MEQAIQTPHLHESIVLVDPYDTNNFSKLLNKLNKKAAKFCLSPIKVLWEKNENYERIFKYFDADRTILSSELRPVLPGSAAKNVIQLKKVKLQYPILKVGNFAIVGRREILSSAKCLTFCITDNQTDIDALDYRSNHNDIECEHCKLARNRRDLFLLKDINDGTYVQVGKSCLAEFTGIDPAACLFMVNLFDAHKIVEGHLDEEVFSRCAAIETAVYLANVAFCIDHFGFVSSKQSYETGRRSTASIALVINSEISELANTTLIDLYHNNFAKYREKALKAIEWAKEKQSQNSFERNVQVLFSEPYLSRDMTHLATAAAGMSCYSKAMSESSITSQFVGKVGDKMECNLTFNRVTSTETIYGLKYWITFVDENGNVLVWKTGKNCSALLNRGAGARIQAKFRIAEHQVYREVKNTNISHVKIL